MPDKVLFDVNVVLDVLENREPHIANSGPALRMAETGQIHGCISASSIDTLAFLIRRTTSSAMTNNILQDLISILDIVPVDGIIIRKALAARWNDPEDAILYYAAAQAGCKKIVTRNVRDFRTDENLVRVIPPEKLMV